MPIDDDHQGFLKECAIFNISQGAIPPSAVTLQLAYNGGKTINMAAASPVAINTSLGTQGVVISDKGTQSHLPIYQLNASNLDLTPDLIDSVFQNEFSELDNTIMLLNSVTYSQNAYFQAWANDSGHNIIIQAQAGVSLNGVDAGSLIVSPGQAWGVYQISPNAFECINIQPTVQDGLTYINGVLGLSGTGASSGYGYVTEQGISSAFGVISFNDMTTYFRPFAPNSTSVNQCNNTTPFYDGFSHLGIQNIGAEAGTYKILFVCALRYGPSNTNPLPNTYVMSASRDGGSVINPIPGGSGSDIPFTINPGQITTVLYPVQVDLDSMSVAYPTIRNTGPSVVAANTAIFMSVYAISIDKVGDIGGTSAGVASLNGLTSNVTITSDNSVSITPSGTSILLSIGKFLTISGTTQLMLANMSYLCLNAGLTSLTLPTANCPAGTVLEIAGSGAGLFSILQSSGQSISHGNASTTVGATGHLDVDGGQNNSALKLVCVTDNTSFMVVNSQGNLTEV